MKLQKGMIRLWLVEGVADPDLVLDLILDPISGLVQMDPGQVVLAVQVATRYELRTSFLSTNQNRTSKKFILIISRISEPAWTWSPGTKFHNDSRFSELLDNYSIGFSSKHTAPSTYRAALE